MQQIGKYKVIRELGAGGFGAVYLAEDPRLGVQLAIKVFQVRDDNLAGQVTSASQDAGQVLKQRFLAEAKTLHQLSGAQHIVQIRDYDEMDDGTPYYVMPYLPRSLVDEIGKDAFTRGKLEDTPKHQYPKKLASGRALLLLEQILTGLAAVHQAGLVHRDIKPANILLDGQNNAQICDFGIAKLPDTEHSQSGVGMGSRNYMSPEQRDSAKHVSAASDVYSVGVVAYRMLTGQLPDIPFQPVSAYAPEVGEPLSQLITQALAQQETQRPPDAGVFLQQFMQAIKSKGQSAGQGTHDEDATGTWIGGEANVKSELKPLQDRILTLLKQQGEITPKDMPVLQALADIGNLDESDLQQLISQSQQQLANDNAQFKALQGWVNAINKQTEQGQLNQDKQQALIEAGIASTGKDKEELETLINSKQKRVNAVAVSEAKPQAIKIDSSPDDKPKGMGKKLSIAIILLLCIGGAVSWQQAWWKANEPKPAVGKVSDNKVSQYRVILHAEPSNAEINVAGVGDFSSGMPQTLVAGNYKVKISKNGYQSIEESVIVNGPTVKTFRLKELQAQNYPLSIVATPQDAKIQILNIQPLYQEGMLLPQGSYQVKVTKPGYEAQTRTVMLTATEQQFSFNLQFEPAGTLNVTTTPGSAILTILSENGQAAAKQVIQHTAKLPAGDYLIDISAEGYVSQQLDVSLLSAQSVNKTINLQAKISESAYQFNTNALEELANQVGEQTAKKNETAEETAIPLVKIEPRYPVQAARDGLSGWVKLSFAVNEIGAVEDIAVLSAEPTGVFDREAIKALSKWKFRPKLVAKKAVKQPNQSYEFTFNLDQ